MIDTNRGIARRSPCGLSACVVLILLITPPLVNALWRWKVPNTINNMAFGPSQPKCADITILSKVMRCIGVPEILWLLDQLENSMPGAIRALEGRV
jgi:hypothetical protein